MRSTIRRIQKRNGGYRLIYIPGPDYVDQLKGVVGPLSDILDGYMHDCCDHAFVKGRNCVTGAEVHIGRRYLLSIDIENFFDSISRSLLEGLIPEEILNVVLEDGAPRQGLLTSPVVANIAMLDVDRKLRSLSQGLGVTYSRYADDIALGFDRYDVKNTLLGAVGHILADAGLLMSKKKTSLQRASSGVISITGVAIDSMGVRPTRKTLRRLRAALHQKDLDSARGLMEWAACKRPRVIRKKGYE